jgi:predicted RNase H-like nuclease
MNEADTCRAEVVPHSNSEIDARRSVTLEGEAVLGIDAAWTDRNPSGVALLQRKDGMWRSLRVAPSYATFCRHFGWNDSIPGAPIDAAEVLNACRQLLGGALPGVVAVDMPLATIPISGRRRADSKISRRFGHRGCAVHSPTPTRPGETGRKLQQGFETAGFVLATASRGDLPALIEVYPHVALLGLTGRERRIPYKAAKTSRYWPGQSLEMRRQRVLEEWAAILCGLGQEIEGIDLPLPGHVDAPSIPSLTRFEDALDGLICAWVAVQFLQDAAIPLGDATAAIWVPSTSMQFAGNAVS